MPNQTTVPYTSLATTNNSNTSKCSGCNRFGHSENRCWVLHLHLRPPQFQRNGEELPEKHAEIEGRNKKDKGKKTEKKDKKQYYNNHVDKKSNHKLKKESRREKGKTKPKPDDTESKEKENTGRATSLNMVHYTNNIPYIPYVPRNTPFMDHAAMMRTIQRTIQQKTHWMFDSGAVTAHGHPGWHGGLLSGWSPVLRSHSLVLVSSIHKGSAALALRFPLLRNVLFFRP